MAERRTPARQSDDTRCSRVLASLDLAQWRWVCGGARIVEPSTREKQDATRDFFRYEIASDAYEIASNIERVKLPRRGAQTRST